MTLRIVIVGLVTVFASCQNSPLPEAYIQEIEHSLGISTASDSKENRFGLILSRIDSIKGFSMATYYLPTEDTIDFGQEFEAMILPIRTYEFQKQLSVTVEVGESEVIIQPESPTELFYMFRTREYTRGANEYIAYIPFGKDTVQFPVNFYVK